ncbi:MAG: hypothetical protein ACTSXY_04355 [Promethearchaeota archaeon]
MVVKKQDMIDEMGGQEEIMEKKELLLDGDGRSMTNLCEDISQILKDKNILFYNVNSKQIVEVGKIKIKNTGENVFTGFLKIKDKRFVTLIEKYAKVGQMFKGKFGEFFGVKSLSPHKADIVLNSHILENSLPQIKRIFQVPLPVIYKGELTFIKKGYDERFNSWLPYDSPELEDVEMDLKKAKKIIDYIFSEFCFKTDQDKINAIAGLITPYLKGLLENFNERPPIFFYLGNRERVGKDYCAGITGILYEGHALDDNPISSGEKGNNNEELRKKITSALITGRKRMHFANNKGYINNAVFEGIATTKFCSDRILGGNELIDIPNEIDFSLSGNVGVTYTPDFANRCRFINLFLDIEDANSRKFNNPILHEEIKKNRGIILSALYSLIRNWIDQGKPKSSLPFTSFSNWADVCGGVMESAGYENPCKIDKESIGLSGDSETSDMKQLFELGWKKYPNTPIKKNDIVNLITQEEGLFSYLDFETLKGKINFGIKLRKFIGRILSGIRLEVVDSSVRVPRQEYLFKKGGSVGSVGSIPPIATYGTEFFNIIGKKDTIYTNSTKFKSLEDFDFPISKKENVLNIHLESGKEYSSDILGDYADNLLEILLHDKKIELIEKLKPKESEK